MIHHPWRDLIAEPVTRDHLVQVYREERVLVEAVSLFAGAALGRSEAVIVVATREHCEALAGSLAADGFDVPLLKSWGQLHLLVADEVLSLFMVDGAPDEVRFRAVIGGLIDSARASRRFREVRVYGEMVNLLWSQNLPAATRLEELWNEVIEEHAISLFCAYCLDGGSAAPRPFPSEIRDRHTHFIPLEGGA
jgi:hypothetical protein